MTEQNIPVVTIDGPSGAGKGTVAQMIAESLSYSLLDSGALYRLVALSALQMQATLDNEAEIVAVAKAMKIRFEPVTGSGVLTWLNDVDVTLQLRDEKTAATASKVAALPALRAELLSLQRGFRKLPGLVADGRDMGTVVFPDAIVKVFLTASAEVRAQRRYIQLKNNGIHANLGSLLDEIKLRDERDQNRASSPLIPATDALMIDSSDLSIEEVVKNVLDVVSEHI